jgi:transporter family protein
MLTKPWFLYALVALFFWGASGVTLKLSTNAISTKKSFLWFCVAMVVITLGLLPFFSFDWGLTAKLTIFALIGGTLNGLGVLTSFAAMETGGKASVVTPLTCLYPIITVLLAISLLGEHLTMAQIVGSALAIVSGVLLAIEVPAKP